MTYEHLNNQTERERDIADSMELLTDAEREALGADIPDEDAAVPIDEVEKIDLPDEEEEEEEEGGEQEETPAAEPEPEAAPEAEPAPAAEPEPEAEPEPAPAAPQQDAGYQVPAVEGYDEKLAALAAERATATKQLLDGELTAEEYSAIDARTMSEREMLTSQQTRHQIAAEMEQQRAVNDWNRSIKTVRDQAKAEGIDYTPGTKEAAGWDRWVRQLGADPENNHQPGEWFLKEAHRLNSMQYNPQKSVPQAAAPAAKPAPKPRTPDLSNIPPTLGSAPAASAVSEGDGGEFAHLAKLQGIALERALARMTPDQEARYLAS